MRGDGEVMGEWCCCVSGGAAKREIARNVKKKVVLQCFDNDTQLKSTAEVDKEKTHVFPNRNIISVGFIALKYPSSQVSLVWKSADPERHEV